MQNFLRYQIAARIIVGKQQSRRMVSDFQQRLIVQITDLRHAHAVPARRNIGVENILPEALSIGDDQVFGSQVTQLFAGSVEQLATDGLWGVVVRRGVGGEDGTLGMGDADELIGSNDVAGSLAAVDDIAPCHFAVAFLFWEAM